MAKNFFLFTAATITLAVFLAACFIFSGGRDKKESVEVDAANSEVTQDPAAPPAGDTKETERSFHVLVIPGHDVGDGGCKYKDYYERDIAADIASKIAKELSDLPELKITTARDTNNWNPVLKKYFTDEKQAIIDWKTERQEEYRKLMSSGSVKYVPDSAPHAEATPETSVKLYGMNKWANENGIDLVVNLHFNDSIRPDMNGPGLFKGFTIFIPEGQMQNATSSREAAEFVFEELKAVQPPELDNLLEDQSLIALGASQTLEAPSMLIEYGYIYEKQLRTETDREIFAIEAAQKTAAGIKKYFDDIKDTGS